MPFLFFHRTQTLLSEAASASFSGLSRSFRILFAVTRFLFRRTSAHLCRLRAKEDFRHKNSPLRVSAWRLVRFAEDHSWINAAQFLRAVFVNLFRFFNVTVTILTTYLATLLYNSAGLIAKQFKSHLLSLFSWGYGQLTLYFGVLSDLAFLLYGLTFGLFIRALLLLFLRLLSNLLLNLLALRYYIWEGFEILFHYVHKAQAHHKKEDKRIENEL